MEWNNHPFEKDTPVRTFGSRSELAAWDAENCDRCIKHDECELCDAIMAAYIGDGRVPPLFVRQSRKHVQGTMRFACKYVASEAILRADANVRIF